MFELVTGRGTGNATSKDAFVYFFKGCTIMGISPPKNAGPLYYMWSLIVNLVCIITSPITGIVGFANKYLQDIITTAQFLSGLQAGLNLIGLPVKCATVTFALKRLRGMESTLAIMDARYTRPEDVALIRKAAVMGNRLVLIFGTSYFIYMLFTVLPPLINGNPPLSVWIPFVYENQSTMHFCVQIFYDLFIMFFVLCHQTLYDSYGPVYIYVISTHFQLLVRRVGNLGTDATKSKDDNMKELVDCVVTHQQILELLATIEPVISTTMFTQFLIISSILCVTMVNMFFFADRSTQFASTLYFLCVLLQTSPCCYFATELKADSEKLPLAIFHCNWVEQDQRFRKVIIYFMHHAQISVELMAMKLFPINVGTNISLAKFSFTLFTFLKEMGIGQETTN
uniref:Odorant receptor n=1 Tax=Zeugodacus cucurbitae TaxID=28588 RepID=A0A6M9TYX4_ZEUCU|nr:odorant receptor [Zeugodacus cucurbitae]